MSRIKQGAGALVSLTIAGAAAVFAVSVNGDADNWIHHVTHVEAPPAPVTLTCAGAPAETMGGVTEGSVEQISDPIESRRAIATAEGEAEELTLTVERLGDGPESGLSSTDAIETLTTSSEFLTYSVASTLSGSVTVRPSGDHSVAMAASTEWLQESGERSGLAVTPCQSASNSHWIVGGSTSIGSSSRLILTNPSATSATVSVNLFTSLGHSDVEYVPAVTLAPGQIREVLLEGSITDPRIALHVTSTGAPVTAHLQVHEVEGFTGRGIEILGAGGPPATTVLIPGVNLTESGNPTLRLVNPHIDTLTVRIDLLSPGGGLALPGGSAVEIAPGAVLDLSLVSWESGLGSVRIESDQTFTASATWATDTDIAWASQVRPTRSGLVTLPGSDRHLVLTADSQASATVTWIDDDGGALSQETVDIKLGESFALAPPAGAAYARLSADSPIAAGVVIAEPETHFVSWLPVTADPSEAASLALSVRN